MYIWGMIMIPALHRAGVIRPHHCEDSHLFESVSEWKGCTTGDNSVEYEEDEECLICNFAGSLIDSSDNLKVDLVVYQKESLKDIKGGENFKKERLRSARSEIGNFSF